MKIWNWNSHVSHEVFLPKVLENNVLKESQSILGMNWLNLVLEYGKAGETWVSNIGVDVKFRTKEAVGI